MFEMRILDTIHEAVDAFSGLLPEGAIVGGSFSDWLPNPASLQSSERRKVFLEAQRAATELCLANLLHAIGLPAVPVVNRPGGDRAWPAGMVGSLTRKGAVVAGAIARTCSLAAVGIDLERVEGGLRDVQWQIASEGLPSCNDIDLALVLAFSAKEAVFKAQYPITEQMLDFRQIALSWTQLHDGRWSALTELGNRGFQVRLRQSVQWVASVAISLA